MKTIPRLIAPAALALLFTATAHAQATLHAVGDLPGDGLFYSQVRDVVKVGGTIHAVGTSSTRDASTDTGFYWTSSGGIVALPDLVANTGGVSPIIASAITPDAVYIAGRARSAASGQFRMPVRYDTGALSSPLDLLGPTNGAAVSISDNGNLAYGFAPLAGVTRAYRYTVSGSAADPIDLIAGMTHNTFAGRAASADGNIALGTAATSSTLSGAGSQAFIWNNTAGTATAVNFLSGGTWNQSIALNNAGTLGLFAGDSTAYTGGAEAFLFDGTTFTALGAPGAGLEPNILGGINADGSVIGLSWNGTGGGSFIYNAAGWHDLTYVATSAGLNLTGWSDFSLLGLSDDATLVWGSALHNGNTEGFIMEFSAGYLSSVSAIPEPSTYAALAGLGALGLVFWRRRQRVTAV
jgi:hypothetical protein